MSMFSVGVVPRIGEGTWLRGWSRIIGCNTILEAEIFAISWAVNLSNEEGWTQFSIESDSKTAVEVLNGNKSPPAILSKWVVLFKDLDTQ